MKRRLVDRRVQADLAIYGRAHAVLHNRRVSGTEGDPVSDRLRDLGLRVDRRVAFFGGRSWTEPMGQELENARGDESDEA